jgi:hypothetical protein
MSNKHISTQFLSGISLVYIFLIHKHNENISYNKKMRTKTAKRGLLFVNPKERYVKISK